MTVTIAQDPVVSYVPDGVDVAFTIPARMKFIEDTDILVYLISATDGSATLQTQGTDYSLTGAGDPNGGTVTFNTAPSGVTYSEVQIYRWVPATQGTDYVEAEKFPAETHEGALDRLTMMVQQLMQRTGGTSFSLSAAVGTFMGLTTDLASWDAESMTIENLSDGVNDTDAATVQQIQDIMAASGNVPAPVLGNVGQFLKATATDTFDWADLPSDIFPTPADPADDGKMIEASGGAYILRTAAQTRTTLGLGTAAVEDVGTSNGDLVQLDATGLPAVDGSQLTNVVTGLNQDKVAVAQDQKSSGTDGQTLTSGAWRTRDINTEVSDPGGIMAIASDQITLDAGTYLCIIDAPVRGAGSKCQSRLQNVTAGSTLLLGASFEGDFDNTSPCTMMGIITVAAAHALEVQSQVSGTTRTSNAAGFGTEVYTTATFIQLST